MWILSSQSPWGWAFSSVTRPWVAQRVWATPIVAGGAATATAAAVGAVLGDRLAQVREVADSAHAVDLTVRDHRDACRVIASVLELLEPGDQQVPARSVTYVSDYAAHKRRYRVAQGPNAPRRR